MDGSDYNYLFNYSNMTPEEQKARELVDQFKKYVESDPFYSNKGGTIQKSIEYNAKQCALIAVEYAIGEIQQYGFDDRIPFLEKVKEAITKLK